MRHALKCAACHAHALEFRRDVNLAIYECGSIRGMDGYAVVLIERGKLCIPVSEERAA